MARYYGHAHPGVADDESVITGINPIAQVIRVITWAVEALLAIRLVLRAFGASTASAFVRFIYDVSYPLVKPFFGIFNTSVDYSFGHLELETIVAMLVYGLLAYVLIALVRSFTRRY